MLNAERTSSRWRPSIVGAVVATLAVGGVVVTPVFAEPAAAADVALYVSPTGDDSADGSVQAPFRTIERARDAVRSLNDDMSGDITVYLRGGSYPVDSTIEFGTADSGSNGHRVIYAAYEGETPVLESGVEISGWVQHDGDIWSAPLTRSDKLRSLYVDGDRYVMASKDVWADSCWGQYSVTAGQAPWAWESGTACDGSAYALDEVPEIPRNQQDLELQTATTWTTAIAGIREVTTSPDGSQRLALFQQPGAAIAENAFNGNLQAQGAQKLSNAYEFLNEPGEFFFDREAQTVFLAKGANVDLSAVSVFAPSGVETVISIDGENRGDRVHDLTFTGITIQHSDWNLAQIDGSSFKQAQQGNLTNLAFAGRNFHDYEYRNVEVQPGAVEVNNASGISFVRNRVQHTGADGIQFNNDVVDSTIEGNATDDIAGSAVNVGDPQHVFIGDGTATNGEHYAADVEGAPTNISVRNNYFRDSAVLFWGSAAVSGYYLDSAAIENNRVERSSWAGISVGWGWGNFDGSAQSNAPGRPTTVARNNSIQRNEIRDIMRFLNDSGAIYTLGNQQGTVIDDNYVNGVRPGHTYGLHPDEGSAFITYNDNVMEFDRDVRYVINSGTWGRQHDLQIRNTYGPANTIFDKDVPNSVIDDVTVVSDFVWPAAAYAVAAGSGVQTDFQDLLGEDRRDADFVLPASVLATTSMTSIPVRETGDDSATIWLAPAGTSEFAASERMTSATGAADSIAVPAAIGTYTLFLVNADGSIDSSSSAAVVRTGPAPRNQTLKHVASQKCLDLPGSSNRNGTQPALWNCAGDANQRFTYTPEQEIRVFGAKCLDADSNGMTPGTPVIIWDCGGAVNQKWTLEADGTIRGVSSGLCLAIADGRTDDNGPAVLETCSDAAGLTWDFPVSAGTVPTPPTEPEPTPGPTDPAPTPAPTAGPGTQTPAPTQPTTAPAPAGTATATAAASATQVERGGSVRVTVAGLKPGEQITAELRSDPMTVRGIPTADSSGRVAFDVRIPAAFPLGAHTIVVTDAAGTVIARLPLTIVAQGQLAATGAPAPFAAAFLGAGLLVAGGAAWMLRRRKVS